MAAGLNRKTLYFCEKIPPNPFGERIVYYEEFILTMEQLDESGSRDNVLEILLSKIARDDEAAMNTFYDMTNRRVYGIALKILKVQELAEEAALDVYAKIWDQAHRFKQRIGTARVWLNTLTRNSSLDILRKENRRARLENQQEPVYIETSGIPPVQETALFEAQMSQTIRTTLRILSKEQREVIMAAYFEGMSHSEIAKAFKQPLGSVKTRIRTGLERLRRELSGSKGAHL